MLLSERITVMSYYEVTLMFVQHKFPSLEALLKGCGLKHFNQNEVS